MKIAQIPQAYLPSIGGIQSYVYRLSRDLTADGVVIDVLTSDLDIDKPVSEKNMEFNVKYFHSVFTIMRNPFVLGLIPHLFRQNYDIIHIHSLWSFSSIVAAIFKKRAKLITTAHGVSIDSQNRSINIISTLYMPFAKYICKRSDKIVVLGKKDREKIIKLFKVPPHKIEVIPNGIEIENVDKKVIDNLLQKYKLENYKIILFTGRILPIKNPNKLIEALPLVKKKIGNVRLLLVGPIEDKYKKLLIELAQKCCVSNDVIFTGEIDRQEVIAVYNIADIFISLGIWEGLPTTMLEAMSKGVPCIMFNSGGVAEVIKDGETGLLLYELNCRKIAEEINYLLENPGLREKIGNNAKKIVLENYRWDAIYDKVKKIYIQNDEIRSGSMKC